MALRLRLVVHVSVTTTHIEQKDVFLGVAMHNAAEEAWAERMNSMSVLGRGKPHLSVTSELAW